MPLQYKTGQCYQCVQEGKTAHVLLVKTIAGRKYCQRCNKKRLGDQREAMGKTRDYRIKNPTGELVLFQTIWESREHKSFINGESLGDNLDVKFMAHVIPKKKYPHFRLYDRNIVLLSWDQHYQWDNGLRSKLMLLPEWEKMFDLENVLKGEYEALERSGG